MASIDLHVYERSDGTRVVSLLPLAGRAMPREWGALELVGVCSVDPDVVSGWIHTCLRDEGYCAVIGRDATTVAQALDAERRDEEALMAPEFPTERTEPIWLG